MRTFFGFVFNNEKMIIMLFVILISLIFFLILVSFIKRDYIVTLKSYKLFQEQFDNFFVTQKNLYPFVFTLIVLSFITFFFLIMVSLYFCWELYCNKDFAGSVTEITKSLFIFVPLLCVSFVTALMMWNSILFQDLNPKVYWFNTAFLAFFVGAVVAFSVESFPHAWAQSDNFNSAAVIEQIEQLIQNGQLDDAEEEVKKREEKLAFDRKSGRREDIALLFFFIFAGVLWVCAKGTGPGDF